ncbi:hypothetical protein HHK36_008792 [Tetracentron sinense]|uniref:N-acetylglucosaminylphosphatidylinositol deacetylase n=1 Tax=Tetracentron sinense TaxID=13715 RepID=A0A834ZG51_TETSI|nr:hypothetical protein HHK36_008792 [Tetracentron sinense]
MAWLFIVILLILLWVVSLCKILHASRSPSKVAFISNGEAVFHKRNILLVMAHPDDESMFFSPTVIYLASRLHSIHILCMSIGNADGKGSIRKEELYQACAVLKVPVQQVKILDHPELQDGFDKMWSRNLLARIIEQEISSHGIDLIITFDNYGVSGHRNHCDVHQGIWFRKLFVAFSSYTYVNTLRKISP